jgi:RHS repeat-associated protein
VSFYGYYGHGNVRYLSDTNAVVSDTYDYDAFGTLIAQYGSTPNNYLYCGQQFDADLGLYYNRARYLNTDSGRFWTRDFFEGEIEDPLTLSVYLYASASPVNNLDPSGFIRQKRKLSLRTKEGSNKPKPQNRPFVLIRLRERSSVLSV